MNADRLGTYEKSFPYGELATAPVTSGEKFATYWRDATGLDYAVNRYYSSQMGRFMTRGSVSGERGAGEPGSGIGTAYVEGDPVNLNDPYGFDRATVITPPITVTSTDTPMIPASLWGIIVENFYSSFGWLNRGEPNADRETLGSRQVQAGTRIQFASNPCPPQPALPAAISNQTVRQNIAEAHQFYDLQLASAPETALTALMGYFAGQFRPGGPWDYKKDYSSGTEDQVRARCSATLTSGRYWPLSGSVRLLPKPARAAQIAICFAGGSCGNGLPLIAFPYGDQPNDAADIKTGYDYGIAIGDRCN